MRTKVKKQSVLSSYMNGHIHVISWHKMKLLKLEHLKDEIKEHEKVKLCLSNANE